MTHNCSVWWQLMQHVSTPPALTCDPMRLGEEFPRWLEKVSAKSPGGVILVLDSVDRIPVGVFVVFFCCCWREYFSCGIIFMVFCHLTCSSNSSLNNYYVSISFDFYKSSLLMATEIIKFNSVLSQKIIFNPCILILISEINYQLLLVSLWDIFCSW